MNLPHDEASITANAEYIAAWQALQAKYQDALKGVKKKVDRSTRPRGRYGETVAPFPEGEKTMVTSQVGRTAKDLNFAEWAKALFGTYEEANTHFSSIRQVTRSGLHLTAEAATRYEQARAAFEASHPGYTFPDTTVGFATRDRHEQRMGIGKLGHPLGLAFDWKAHDNPHQLTALERYMLRFFGSDMSVDDKGQPQPRKGQSTMALKATDDEQVRDMGVRTAHSQGLSGAHRVLLGNIGAQFDAMAATSDRVQENLKPHLPKLAAAEQMYLGEVATRVDSVRHMERRSRTLRKLIQQAQQEYPTPQLTLDISQADRRVALAKVREARLVWLETHGAKAGGQEYAASARQKADAERQMQETHMFPAMEAWGAALDAEVQRLLGGISADDVKRVPSQAVRERMVQKIKAANTVAQLDGVVAAHPGLFNTVAAAENGTQLDAYRKVLLARVEAWQKIGAAVEQAMVPRTIRDQLDDPTFVLGTPHLGDDDRYELSAEVASPPVLQYARRGFVSHDAMPPRPDWNSQSSKCTDDRVCDKDGRRYVFNREVVVLLATYGWAPGASFGDTMHFDFIEGYDKIVGGRKGANMKSDAIGPKGNKYRNAAQATGASK